MRNERLSWPTGARVHAAPALRDLHLRVFAREDACLIAPDAIVDLHESFWSANRTIYFHFSKVHYNLQSCFRWRTWLPYWLATSRAYLRRTVNEFCLSCY